MEPSGSDNEHLEEPLNTEDIIEEYNDEYNNDAMIIDETNDDDDDEKSNLVLAVLDLHDGEPVYSLSQHPLQKNIIVSSGGNDKAIVFKVSDDPTGLQVEQLYELSGHTDTVEHTQWNFDGTYLATGSLDGNVKIWKGSELVNTLEGATEVTWLSWHPKGNVLAVGSADGTAWLWSLPSGNCLNVLTGNSQTSTCGAFSSDGKVLVTSGDGVVVVWNCKEGSAEITYSGGNFPDSTAISIACHPVLPVALVGFSDNKVAAIHLQHHQILTMMQVGELPEGEDQTGIEYVGYMRKFPIMVAASLDGSISLWDSNNYKVRGTIKNSIIDGVTSACWLEREGLVAFGGLNSNIGIWDVRSGELRGAFENGFSENVVYSLVEVPSLNLLIAAFDDGKTRIYRID